jgi:dihydroxyacetone kinase
MLDAVAVGNTFTPPSVESFCEAFRAADAGRGVVLIYGNYPKDIVNAEKAIQIAAAEDIRVLSIVANDDIATADHSTRRGTTGEVFLWKVGGAAAALGYGQDEVALVTQKALANTRSIGVGIASCIIPEVGRPNYLIEKGTMEIGVGHHGLPGSDTCKLKTADATAEIMLSEIMRDMALAGASRWRSSCPAWATRCSASCISSLTGLRHAERAGNRASQGVCRELLYVAGHDGCDAYPHARG